MKRGSFVVATPTRSVCDENARVLESIGRLRFLALGTRRGTAGVPPERTRLKPVIGLVAYLCARAFSSYRAESCRFALLPWFDRWVLGQLQAGDHLLSSYGYTAESFRWVRRQGGKTFLEAGNSHIDRYWEVVSEEHRRWKCPYPPFAPHWLSRSQASLRETDFVLSPSSWVTGSFLERGFRPEQILRNVYPVDLSLFTPAPGPRPEHRPLTLISTGQLSLRKGTPYLLEAFRLVRQAEPDARLLLTNLVAESARPILERCRDLPIEWAPALPHPQLAERLRSADVFILPSLEEGLARTACEALACGLPAILTASSGAADLLEPEVGGSIVPIRDPEAIAASALAWGRRIRERRGPPTRLIDADRLSFAHFAREFAAQLETLGFL